MKDLIPQLQDWAIRHSITHTALDDLLVNLSKYYQFKNLPKDSRTIKNPNQNVNKKYQGWYLSPL